MSGSTIILALAIALIAGGWIGYGFGWRAADRSRAARLRTYVEQKRREEGMR